MSKFLNEFEETWIDDLNDSNFNIGDKIICISKSENFYKITIGKEYEIIGFHTLSLLPTNHPIIINDNNIREWFPKHCFKCLKYE